MGESLAVDILHSRRVKKLSVLTNFTSASNIYQTTGHGAAKYSSPGLFGDHIRKVPPVPIPNTVVKLSEPMIVPTSAKVGIAEFLKPLCVFGHTRVFLLLY